MQTGDRQTDPSTTLDWVPDSSGTLPHISPQDLAAMESLFEHLDPESVERDLLQPPPAIDAIEWDLVDLLA